MSVLINEEFGRWLDETAPLKLWNPMNFWVVMNGKLVNLRAIPRFITSIILTVNGWLLYLIVLFLSLRWSVKLIWKK